MVLVQLNVTNAKTMLLYTVIYKKKEKKNACVVECNLNFC